MMRSVLGELVQHPEQTTEQAIEAYVKTVRGDISDGRLQEIIVKMRFLDSYATSFFREQAVRILVESGIHVTAYGVGWDQCEWSDNPYLTYGGKVLAPQILPLMNDSKIVLNTMTWFKAGAHDRIFNGMLAGAAVVTDDSTYLRRTFTDGKELVMFSLKELQTLPERVFDLFGHSSHMQELADCGYRAAKEGHTWKNRAEYIRECYFD
jgi:spore maturation protein CgeB